jgi:hypothetical protein
VPFPVMYAAATILGAVLKRPPVTTDQLRMLGEGSTCDIAEMRRVFGIEPRGFYDGLTVYLCSGQSGPTAAATFGSHQG